MIAKYLTRLLLMSVFFALMSIGALYCYTKNTQRWNNIVAKQAAFDGFIADVKSGKQNPTTDKWIEIATAENNRVQSDGRSNNYLANLLRDFGLFGLILAFLQIRLVFIAKRDSQKPMS
jgi:hypothetical protein